MQLLVGGVVADYVVVGREEGVEDEVVGGDGAGGYEDVFGVEWCSWSDSSVFSTFTRVLLLEVRGCEGRTCLGRIQPRKILT